MARDFFTPSAAAKIGRRVGLAGATGRVGARCYRLLLDAIIGAEVGGSFDGFPVQFVEFGPFEEGGEGAGKSDDQSGDSVEKAEFEDIEFEEFDRRLGDHAKQGEASFLSCADIGGDA